MYDSKRPVNVKFQVGKIIVTMYTSDGIYITELKLHHANALQCDLRQAVREFKDYRTRLEVEYTPCPACEDTGLADTPEGYCTFCSKDR